MAFDFKKITDVDMQDTVTESTNVYIEENGAIKRISANEFSGMPKLAEDGSDANKVLKANADGSGYELVEFNVATSVFYVNNNRVYSDAECTTMMTKAEIYSAFRKGSVYVMTKYQDIYTAFHI